MDKKTIRTVVAVLSIILSIAVVVLAVLQISGVWETSAKLFVPLLGLTNLCQAYMQWDTNRKTAYFCIGTSIIIFLCSIAGFFLK